MNLYYFTYAELFVHKTIAYPLPPTQRTNNEEYRILAGTENVVIRLLFMIS